MSNKTFATMIVVGTLALVLAAPQAAADGEIEVDVYDTYYNAASRVCRALPATGVAIPLPVDASGELGDTLDETTHDARNVRYWCLSMV